MKDNYEFKKAKRGALVPQKGKSRITIYLDNEIIDSFRDRADKLGHGYQTMINEALRASLSSQNENTLEVLLRNIVNEEASKLRMQIMGLEELVKHRLINVTSTTSSMLDPGQPLLESQGNIKLNAESLN